MKRILVPIDFSKEADNAAHVAVSIAKKCDGMVYFLHMLELPVEFSEPTEFMIPNQIDPTFFMDMAKKRFDTFLKLPFLKSVKVQTNILFYKAFNGIQDEAKALNIDLIVMGSKGATGLEEVIIGSNTEKVVRNSDIPVLVVKEFHKDFDIKHLVFASDFDPIGRKSFQKIIDFAKFFDARIHLLYVNTIHNFKTTEESNQHIQDYLKGFIFYNYLITIYNARSVERGILDFSKSIKADAIALNTSGRSGLSKLFNGSIASEITNHAMLPVVTFKL